MPASHSPSTGAGVITDDLVAALGLIAGLDFPEERLPVIAQRLREMHALASDLDSVELGSEEPATRFEPTWPNGGAV